MNNKDFLNLIRNISIHLRVTTTQAIFLFAMHNQEYSFDIPTQELLELINKGYIVKYKLTKNALIVLEKLQENSDNSEQIVEKIVRNSNFPILTEETAILCKQLAKHFIGNDGIPPKWFKEYTDYTNGNAVKVPFLWLFTQMFPTKGSSNGNWNKHFDVEWQGMMLRKVSKGWLRKFSEIYTNKDIGLFLLGTYLYIKSSYSEKANTYYIKSIDNYMSTEWQYWYSEAQRQLEEGELKELLTRNTNVPKNNHTILI